MENLVADVFTISLSLLSLATLGDGLNCYVCTSSDVSWDEECESGNQTLPYIECPNNYDGRTPYCFYKKTQWKSISGANSVLRSCTDEPLYRNGQYDLEDVIVWYQSCTMDLCNNAPSFSKDQTVAVLTTIFFLILTNLVK